jgi:beta-lactamase regulating signal transducer with metallopeptidase domain
VVACGGLLIALAAAPATMIALATGGSRQVIESPGVVAPPFQNPRSALLGALVGSLERGSAGVMRPSPPVLANRTIGATLSAFVAFWVAGVLLLTVRLAFGWWRVRRLHADALAAPPSHWLAMATQIARTLGLPRAIHVVDSLQVDTPTVIGWLRPVVLMPIAALANLTTAQVEAILAHELAHVRRHDFVVNLLQTVAETVLFYHPAVWWLSARIRTEREHCCDDIAVDICGDPVGYAEALTALAAWGRLHAADDPLQPAPLAVAATGGSLLHRVRRLLRFRTMGASVGRQSRLSSLQRCSSSCCSERGW